METVGICDLCGSVDSKPFEVYERYGRIFTLVECAKCGLVYLDPRPGKEEIADYYDDAYTGIHGVYRQPRIQSLVLPLLRWALRVRYEGNSVQTLAIRYLLWPWEFKWKAILRNAHLENLDRIGRVLDVGCGRGYFLATMRRWGFDCYGCEPDPQAAQTAREKGLAVVCSDLLKAGYPDGYFDIVRFNHVLEHVHEPTVVLMKASKVMRPCGLLIVEVPNHLGIVNQAFRQSEDVPRHLYSFSTRTLREYYKKVGLRVIRIETQTRHPHDVYSQLGRWATEMTKGENLRPRLEAEIARFWSVRNRTRQLEYMATAKFFDSVGCGSSVIAIGTKD